MKKLFLFLAAMMTATVTNLSAATTGTAPDMHDFLYFVGLNGNDTLRLNKWAKDENNLATLTATFEYSKDRIKWDTYSWGTYGDPINERALGAVIELNAGDTVFFRAKGENGKNATMSHTNAGFQFASGADDQIAAGGNVMSLYDASCEQLTMTPGGFCALFIQLEHLVSAPKLPATQLADSCYKSMFLGCSLTTAPALPATKLAKRCYGSMFKDCSFLTTAPPALPADTLAEGCYEYMFDACPSLTKVPDLMATTLAKRCYSFMFSGCTSLKIDSCAGYCDGAKLVVPTEDADLSTGYMFRNCQGDSALTSLFGIKLGSYYCITDYTKGPDTLDYLHFVGLNGNDSVWIHRAGVNLTKFTATFEYSTDRTKWKEYPLGKIIRDSLLSIYYQDGAVIELNANDTVFFRAKGVNNDGKNATLTSSSLEVQTFKFGKDDKIAAGGNTMSLYDATCTQDTMTDYGFYMLFINDYQLVSPPKLPAKKMASDCYSRMFSGCSSLTTAPELPAMELDLYCYKWMFQNCKSLTVAPELPATALTTSCYEVMFENCTSLTEAPKLPAKTLGWGCYGSMFSRCTSITAAPELPATDIAPHCYSSMFSNCTSITTAPELPATVMMEACYRSMFFGCSSLTTAPKLAATQLSKECYSSMFKGCTKLAVYPFTETCDGAEMEMPTNINALVGETNWNREMFENCHGDTALTAQFGIQTGGHYCVKEYIPIKIAVVYDLQDYGEAIKNDTIVSGDKLTAPTTPTDEGVEFVGWFKENTYENPFDFTTPVIVAQDTTITLYAYWIQKAVKGSFVSGDEKGFELDENISGTVTGNATISSGCMFFTQPGAVTINAQPGFSIVGCSVEYNRTNAALKLGNENVTSGQTVQLDDVTNFTLTISAGANSPQRMAKNTAMVYSALFISSIKVFYKTAPAPAPYTRNVTSGNYGTICLEREAVSLKGAAFYEVLGKIADSQVVLAEVDTLEAGKPYVFKADSSAIECAYNTAKEAVTDTVPGNGIIGSFAGCDVPTGMYIISLTDSKLHKTGTDCKIDANRAYFNLSTMTNAPQAPARKLHYIGIYQDAATGLQDVENAMPIQKMMINGQLMILRDGKMYNVMGARSQE